MKYSRLIPAILIGATLFISGCSSKTVKVSNSDFLKNQNGFVETGKLQGTKTYIDPSVNFEDYQNIYIVPIKVISSLSQDEMTESQKLLVKQISEYITRKYKDLVKEENFYNLVDSPNYEKTLIYEGSISSVNVKFDDLSGMNFMPMMFVGTMIGRATFQDGNIRVLGEGRLKDAQTHKVLLQMMRLHKGKQTDVDADELVFKDVKPVLDDWLKDSSKNLKKISKGLIKVDSKQNKS